MAPECATRPLLEPTGDGGADAGACHVAHRAADQRPDDNDLPPILGPVGHAPDAEQHLGRRSVSDFQRGVLALRKRDKDDVAEEEAILEMYKSALGMA